MTEQVRHGVAWRGGLIALAGTLAYWNGLSGPFIFDDQLSIVGNESIRQWWHLAGVLSPQRELPVAGRPLVNVTFAINYAIGGLDPGGYHVWNVAVHVCCALLLFGIVRHTLELLDLGDRLGWSSTNLGFATALVWMLHPLNTEAVDYMTQRTELMMGLFYLSTLYASIRAHRSSRRFLWYALAVLSCALGMACKESMVTAPVVVALYDSTIVFRSVRRALRARWRFYLGLATAWPLLVALVWSGPRRYSAGFSTDVSPWTYLLNQTVMITRYLRLAIWPSPLVIAYGWPKPLSLGDVMPYALLIVGLLLLTAVALIRWPSAGLLGAWFFVTLAPTSSIVPIATEVGAERRMYLPLMAVVTLAVIGVATIARPAIRGRRHASAGFLSGAAAAALVVVSGLLAAGTVARNREYRSALGIAYTALERRPSGIAHAAVGGELANLGRHDEAITQLREAIRDYPRAHYDLGGELFTTGRLDEAIDELEAFIRREPLSLQVISARTMIGRAFMKQQRLPAAIGQFRLVLQMNPSNTDAKGGLADALFAQQAFGEASVLYQEYLASRPTDVGGLTNLGIAFASTGKMDEAIAVFHRAVEVEPRNTQSRNNLVRSLLDHDRVEEAAAEARQTVDIDPNDPVGHDLLGRALALQGKLEEARVQFEQSLRSDPTYTQARDDLDELVRPRGSSTLDKQTREP